MHAADKPFEGISKAVCERISHSRPDNVNSYRTDEDFFVNGYGSAVRTTDDFLLIDDSDVRRLKILARNKEMKRPN